MLECCAECDQVETCATVRLGDERPEHTRLGQRRPQRAVEAWLVGALELPQTLVGRRVTDHLTGQFADRLLFFVQTEIHRGPLVLFVRCVVRWVCLRLLCGAGGQPRNARGRPRPNMPMRSRWISLVPPPKVRMSRLR